MAIQPPDRGWIFWPVGTGSACIADVTGSLGGHAVPPWAAARCATRRLGLD